MATIPDVATADTSQATTSQIDLGQLAAPAATTVQDQLTGILNTGGPLMQQAATRGNQAANARGLLNSSMGIQAAQEAVIGAAAPIAQADASNINQMSQFNAAQRNAAITGNVNALNQGSQFNTQQSNAMQQFNAQQRNQQNLQLLDSQSREALAGIEARYKNQIQASSSASSVYEQYLKNLADISTSDLSAEAKTAAIDNQSKFLDSQMKMLQSISGLQWA